MLNTKEQYMKESDILADNATIKQLQKGILLNTKQQYMKDSNIPAGNATIKQLPRAILLHTIFWLVQTKSLQSKIISL